MTNIIESHNGQLSIQLGVKPAVKSTGAQEPIPNIDPVELAAAKRLIDEAIESWRSTGKLWAKQVSLTPASATYLLRQSQLSRPMQVLLALIKRDMAAGRFVLNGESVIVTSSGRFADGNHRARAVGETGITIEVVLVVGVDDKNIQTIDCGTKKSIAHILIQAGLPEHAFDVGAIVRRIFLYRQKSGGRLSRSGQEQPSQDEKMLIVNSYYDTIMSSVAFVGGTPILPTTLMAWAHWEFRNVELSTDISGERREKSHTPMYPGELADTFMRLVISG